jgi:hypothetical protein
MVLSPRTLTVLKADHPAILGESPQTPALPSILPTRFKPELTPNLSARPVGIVNLLRV